MTTPPVSQLRDRDLLGSDSILAWVQRAIVPLLLLTVLTGWLTGCAGSRESDSEIATNGNGDPELAPEPAPAPSPPNPPAPVNQPPANNFEIGLFSTDELFAAGGGGCGMALQPAAEARTAEASDGFVLFHGADGSPMLMKINNKLVPFKLEEGRGPAFYGQTPSQTFSNAELDLIAVVDVETGEPGEIESVAIPTGSIQLLAGPDSIVIPVEGDAGC